MEPDLEAANLTGNSTGNGTTGNATAEVKIDYSSFDYIFGTYKGAAFE